jgi:hypothetical protein
MVLRGSFWRFSGVLVKISRRGAETQRGRKLEMSLIAILEIESKAASRRTFRVWTDSEQRIDELLSDLDRAGSVLPRAGKIGPDGRRCHCVKVTAMAAFPKGAALWEITYLFDHIFDLDAFDLLELGGWYVIAWLKTSTLFGEVVGFEEGSTQVCAVVRANNDSTYRVWRDEVREVRRIV